MNWSQKIAEGVGNSRTPKMALKVLQSLERQIREHYEALGEETIDHVNAIALICSYKLRFLREIEEEKGWKYRCN